MVPPSGSQPAIGSFEFHGDAVTVVTNEQGSWAVLAQLSQNLSLNPNGQRQMVERKSWSQGKTCVLHVMLPGQARPYPQYLIHERIVPMWLANVTSTRIADDTKREKIEQAQVELADALYAYVTQRSQPAATPALPQDYEEALVHLLGKVRENRQLESRVKELEPAAQAWDVLASAEGDYSLREAALILNRDHGISTGQNRLLRSIRELDMIDRKGVPYAKHASHLVERATSYIHPTLSKQIRVTAQGLRYLHKRLGGEGPLDLALPVAG
jgi:phage antirepressor YoqD-like protein